MTAGGTGEVPGFTGLVEIGRGGFGVVYRAVETALGREVAVKVLAASLDSVARQRFAREGAVMARLSGHPNVVPVYAVGVTASGRPYLVMPLLSKGSLAGLGPLPWAEAVRVAVRLAGALETAHRAGIVHRDVKPGNVLLSGYGEPLLADFGIARVEGGFETAGVPLAASLAYAAPEVLDGRGASVASDVYALGATLYALIAGAPPFEGPDIATLYLRIARDRVPDAAGALPEVRAALARAMAKDPRDRPPSAAEFGELLRAAQRAAGLPPTDMAVAGPEAARDDPTVTAAPARRPRRRIRWTVVATDAVLGLAGAATAAPVRPTGPVPTREPLVLNDSAVTVAVHLTPGALRDIRIAGRSGEQITGTVHASNPPARPVPVGVLAGGAPLEQKTLSGYDLLIEPVTLAADGTYVLRVGPAPDGLDASVSLSDAPPDLTRSTTVGGAPVPLSLRAQQRALVSFPGGAGQRVRVTWTWTAGVPRYTSLTLRTPDGTVAGTWSALGTGGSAPVGLATAGTYTVVVSVDGGGTGAGRLAIVPG